MSKEGSWTSRVLHAVEFRQWMTLGIVWLVVENLEMRIMPRRISDTVLQPNSLNHKRKNCVR